MKPKIYLYGTSGQYGNYLAALTEAGAEPVLSRDLFRACGCDGLLLRYFVGQCSCKSAPGLVHCEKRGEADESHHTGTKSGAGTTYGG